jgi:thymidine phosphorylase
MDVASERSGRVLAIDNRRLALTAKLAGAPEDKAAGIDLHARTGMPVDSGQPLFTLHAESTGTLEYALDFFRSHRDIIRIGDEA